MPVIGWLGRRIRRGKLSRRAAAIRVRVEDLACVHGSASERRVRPSGSRAVLLVGVRRSPSRRACAQNIGARCRRPRVEGIRARRAAFLRPWRRGRPTVSARSDTWCRVQRSRPVSWCADHPRPTTFDLQQRPLAVALSSKCASDRRQIPPNPPNSRIQPGPGNRHDCGFCPFC